MPFIRFSAFKYFPYCFKLVAVILLLGKIMPTYLYCAEKGLVYIIIITLFSCQPSFYAEYIKLNIHSFCNICLVSNAKCIFLIFTKIYNSLV